VAIFIICQNWQFVDHVTWALDVIVCAWCMLMCALIHFFLSVFYDVIHKVVERNFYTNKLRLVLSIHVQN